MFFVPNLVWLSDDLYIKEDKWYDLKNDAMSPSFKNSDKYIHYSDIEKKLVDSLI